MRVKYGWYSTSSALPCNSNADWEHDDLTFKVLYSYTALTSSPEGEVPRLGVDGVNIGVYTESNNKLFPPMIDIDALKVSKLI